MTNPRVFGLLTLTVFAVLVPVATSAQVAKESDDQELARRSHECSIATIKGSWVFQSNGLFLPSGPLAGNIVGIATINADGTLQGKYDFEGPSGFFPGIIIAGNVTVNSDCTGTLSFSQVDNPDADTVTQSIVIGEGGKVILGLFEDPTGDIGTTKAIRMN